MILWKFTLREIKSRPGRATLTLLSIVIGVAAVVAVNLSTATTNRACEEMYLNVAGRAALEVAADGEDFFDEAIVAQIAKTPGVTAVVPSVQRLSTLRFQGKRVALLTLGIDPAIDKAVRDYELEQGNFFEKKYDAMLEVGFARGLGAKVGDQVKLLTPSGLKTFTLTGLLSPRGAAGFKQGGVIFLPLKTAEQLFSRTGYVNRVSVVVGNMADEKIVAETITPMLPQGLSVRSPTERSRLSKEMLKKVETALNFAYGMIGLLALITIVNTFLMNVGERRRLLAVMRAIGATRTQLMRILILESLLMGVVGTILGAVVGVGGAYLLTRSMGQVYGASLPTIQLTPMPFVLAAILGPAVSMIAMIIPAWIAGRISPLEGMRFIAREKQSRVTLKYVVIAVFAFVLSGAALAACIVGYLPTKMLIFLGLLFTLAFLLLVPMLLGPVAGLVATLLQPLLNAEGRVAHRQVLRRRVRTTLTVFILYVAVSTAISLGSNILDTVNDIHTWLAKSLSGDFIVRATTQDVSSGLSPKMPESLTEEFRVIPGVSNVDAIRYITTTVRTPNADDGKLSVNVAVRNFTGQAELPLDIREGDPKIVRQRLAQGEVVLGTVLAHRLGVKVGDEFTLDTREGPRQLRVAGTAAAYMVNGMLVYMEGATAKRLINIEGVDVYVVNAVPGQQAAVEAKLQSICDANGVMLSSFADLRKRVDDLTKSLIAGLWGLLVLAAVVGAFAIVNTLTMNVLEQTREIALLRVVAMTRWQVRKTILSQAIIIGVIGVGTGAVGGVIGSYVMNLSTSAATGHAPVFAFHPSLAGICFLVGILTILVAAWIPAERAARLKLLIALQYE